MTPAQQHALAVALDGLREQGVEPADVVRVVLPELLAEVEGVLERGDVMCLLSDRTRCYDAKCCREGRLRTMLGQVCEYPHPKGTRCTACGNSSKLSPPETAAGVHAQQPQAPQEETVIELALRIGVLEVDANEEYRRGIINGPALARLNAERARQRALPPRPPGETPSPHEGMPLSPDPSSWRCGTCGFHACICDSFPGAGAG